MINIRMLVTVLACLIAKGILGNPFSSLGGEEVDHPFGNCKIYGLGGRGGARVTNNEPMQNGSKLAFYPLTEDETMLSLRLMFRNTIFKVSITGSMVSLVVCDMSEKNCEEEEIEGVKHPDYITSHHWNIVKVILNNEWLEIHVGYRMVKSMLMTDHNFMNAHWSVKLDSSHGNSREKSYLVQFMCKDYDSKSYTTTPRYPNHSTEKEIPYSPTEEETHPPWGIFPKGTTTAWGNFTIGTTTAATTEPQETEPQETTKSYIHGTPVPHTEEEKKTVEPEESNLVGLIVGLVVAGIIILALVIFLYNYLRKRQSANLNEDAPLHQTKQSTN